MIETSFAHSGNQSDRSDRQGLAEQLENVAALAAENVAHFGASEWGRAATHFHDLDEFADAFQQRSGGSARVDHTKTGALWASEKHRSLPVASRSAAAVRRETLSDQAAQPSRGKSYG